MSGFSRALRRGRALAIGALAVAAVVPAGEALAAPSQNGCNARANNTYPKLLECTRLDQVREHQAALQEIADENDGNRFSGFPGYDASVDYVVERLEAAGYDPEVQEFDYLAFEVVGPSALQQTAPNAITYVAGVDFGAITQSDPGDVTAAVTPVDLQLGLGNTSTSGCEASDFAGFPAGNIALLQRGNCTFEIKAENAAAAGAVGIVIFNQGNTSRPRPQQHPGRHAHGQQHQRHPGDRHHLCPGCDAVPDPGAADAGLRQHAAPDPAHLQRDRREDRRERRQRGHGRRAPRLGARRDRASTTTARAAPPSSRSPSSSPT